MPAYIINPREQPQGGAPQGGGAFGSWEQAGTALETHALPSHQSEHREIEYQAHGSAWAVIGVNSAGISASSNTAAVVL